jgi:hypothetical protein
MDRSNDSAAGSPGALFTGDDYQLVVDAMYREEDRRELFERYNGIPAPSDDQLERLGDLARRIGIYIKAHGRDGGDSVAAT